MFLYRCLFLPCQGIDDSALSSIIEWPCCHSHLFCHMAQIAAITQNLLCPEMFASCFKDLGTKSNHFLCVFPKPTLSCSTCLVCPGSDCPNLQLSEPLPKVLHVDSVAVAGISLGNKHSSASHLGFLSVWF